MPLSKSITAIHTVINGRKKFISHFMAIRTWDNKRFVYFTDDPEKANDFCTQKLAEDFIPLIVNPQNRIFYIENVTVDAARYNTHASAAQLVS